MKLSGKVLVSCISVLWIVLPSCDRTSLQRTFSADPKTSQWQATPAPTVQLPANAPETVDPNAEQQGQLSMTEQEMPPRQAGNVTNLFTDPSAVPLSLKPYVQNVGQLNVVTNLGGAPNQTITRAMFARWLVEVNNRIYRDRPVRQIRLATASKPAFVDVPANRPEFPYVQGLAEAGYLPSPLSGDSAQTRFRPNDPLTRETLLLWKVPIDRQQILPTVSSERVKQVWGFKDVNRITPTALSAVAADRQNGDLSTLRRVFGSTLLFQPQKPVTYAEAATALWFIGIEGDSLSAKDLLRSEQQQEKAATLSPSPEPKPTKSSP